MIGRALADAVADAADVGSSHDTVGATPPAGRQQAS
jgi:hypothetical protein